jgi:NAD(P)-dependent dehydrogenase (short-subunit alcohol dehydrogenase family)
MVVDRQVPSGNSDADSCTQSVVIITGAAGDIGRAIALRLRDAGIRVAACDLDLAGLCRSFRVESADRTPDGMLLLKCDVTDVEETRKVVGHVRQTWGRIDALVNNAATVTETAPVCDIDAATWQRTLGVNLTGAWHMACAVMPVMAAARRGVVLNVASQLGHVGAMGRGAYGVSKAGLLALTRAIAVDYAAQGIRAVSLSPGAVLTGRVARRYGSAEQAAAVLGPRNLTGRIGTVEEVAEAAFFLLRDSSAFITGTDLLVDGGYTAV